MKARIAHIEGKLKQLLSPAKTLTNIADVRVIGTIGVIEMKNDVNVGDFQKECVKRGVWIRPFGKNVYVMPPYVISDDQLTHLVGEMIEIVKTLP
jgi:adenosylmethionine-8-amino-7-oxononanoate aminotransferase